MLRKNNRPQLRRCAFCQKVGHNKSTCREFIAQETSTPPSRPASAPLKFFVHHVVNQTPSASPHIVDLKPAHHELWNQVETDTNHASLSLYHSYHQSKPQAPTSPLFSPIKPLEISQTNESVKNKEMVEMPVIKKTSFFKKFSGLFSKQKNGVISTRGFLPIDDQTLPQIKAVADLPPIIVTTLPTINPVVAAAPQKQSQKITETVAKEIVKEKETTPVAVVLPKIKPIHNTHLVISYLQEAFSLKHLKFIVFLAIIIAITPGPAFSYFQNLQNIKEDLTDDSTAGFLALQDSTVALKAANIDSASNSTQAALTKFNNAIKLLEQHQVLQTLANLVPVLGSEIKSRQNILLAGQEITLGNSYLLSGIKLSQTNASSTLTERAAIIAEHLNVALPNYQKAIDHLASVDPNTLPPQYQHQFNGFTELFKNVIGDLKNLSDMNHSLQEIFGGEGLRRYLLVFQNPDEIRATGGFMGSFALLDIKNGQVVKFTLPSGGTYDVQGQLTTFVEPPAPLLLTNKRWEFQDANWFPDFPASAEKIMWFYRHSRNITVDGVIAINATVLERLLSIVGPITDAKRDLTINADNALPTLQTVIEEGPEKSENKPKQVLSDLAGQFITYFQNIPSDAALPLLSNLSEALDNKEIQTYFINPESEAIVKSYGWSGQIQPTQKNQDYLLAINSNIGGYKSDAKIKQTISHQAIINTNGEIIDNVVITREHTGNNGEKLYGQNNIDYLRLYVPEGSQLISASGFTWPNEKSFKAPEKWYTKDEVLTNTEKEIGWDDLSGTRITNEFNKTAFGNWIITEPGTTSKVQFTYRLPFKIDFNVQPNNTWDKIISNFQDKLTNYQLIAQKQSGIDSYFESQVIFPDGWQPQWVNGENLTLAKNGFSVGPTILSKDAIWSAVLKK